MTTQTNIELFSHLDYDKLMEEACRDPNVSCPYIYILEKCNDCKCCDEHAQFKPTVPDYIPINPNAKTMSLGSANLPKECICPCRNTARNACRVYQAETYDNWAAHNQSID